MLILLRCEPIVDTGFSNPEATMDLVLNGRFLSRPMTGVERVATELTCAIAQELAERPAGGILLSLAQPAGRIPDRGCSCHQILALPRRSGLPLRGYLWEQISLALLDRRCWVMSFCNMGPVLRRHQVVMLHDAQIHEQPQVYSAAFRGVYRILQPRLARRAALVLTVSEYSRRQLEAHGVVPEGKARVVHNGVDHILRVKADTEILRRFDLPAEGYVLAIGSRAAHKNLDFLIRAAGARKSSDVPLVIAGGANARVFARSGDTAGDGVRLLGRVSDAELRALYENAQTLAFASSTEGFGLPAAEAMACGCPVIATTGGAVPEICGAAAQYADPEDQPAWTAALDELSASPRLREDLVRRGQKQVRALTWRRAARTVLAHMAALERPEGTRA